MALAYVPPGVTVQEVVNPTFSPFTVDPTSICIIGPGRGYETHSEVVLLSDNAPVTLGSTGITLTPTITDASDPLGAPYVEGRDFIFDAVHSTLKRSMQTAIANNEEVVVTYNDATTTYTEWAKLNKLDPYIPANRSVTVTRDNVYVQREGIVPAGDYVVTAGTGGAVHQIKVAASPTILATGSKQRVYIYYTKTDNSTGVEIVSFNGTTNVNIPNTGSTNASTIVVRNAPVNIANPTQTAIRYTRDSNADHTNNDWAFLGLNGTGSSATAEAAYIARSKGTTTIGQGNADAGQVRVVYQSTPADYYLPTRCFSSADVEDKYGPALDTTGAISSPVTLAASIAFNNGAPDLVVQALFHVDTNTSLKSPGAISDVATNLTDWKNTLANLRDIEDINILVPLVSSAGGSTTDNHVLTIFQAIGDHFDYMAANNQYLIAICGEDATVTGNVADKSVLQGHALSLQNELHSEGFVLVSPARFQYANPVTGTGTLLGGQYAAAAVSGMLGSRGIQETLTHKQVGSLVGVSDFRSEMDKNADAAAGLLVVEDRRGIIRVRHAVTVAVNNINTRELSVVRAKHYMIETVLGQIEDQIIGQTPADGNAPFVVELTIIDVLERMVSEGAIVTYQDIQARQTTTDPTRIEVQFSYLPAFPLNYVDVKFAINTASGTIETTDTQGV